MAVTILRRHKRGLAATSKALAQVLDSIAQIKQQRGRQAIQQAVMEASMGGGTEDERMGRVNQSIQQVRGERPQGLLEGILSAFNPNVPTFNGPTPTEDLITGAAVRDMFRSPYEDEYRRDLMKDRLMRQYTSWQAEADTALEELDAIEGYTEEELSGVGEQRRRLNQRLERARQGIEETGRRMDGYGSEAEPVQTTGFTPRQENGVGVAKAQREGLELAESGQMTFGDVVEDPQIGFRPGGGPRRGTTSNTAIPPRTRLMPDDMAGPPVSAASPDVKMPVGTTIHKDPATGRQWYGAPPKTTMATRADATRPQRKTLTEDAARKIADEIMQKNPGIGTAQLRDKARNEALKRGYTLKEER